MPAYLPVRVVSECPPVTATAICHGTKVIEGRLAGFKQEWEQAKTKMKLLKMQVAGSNIDMTDVQVHIYILYIQASRVTVLFLIFKRE
jgi:hypothetical protein